MGASNQKSELAFQELEKAYQDADAKAHPIPKEFGSVWDSILWSPPISNRQSTPPYINVYKPANKAPKKKGSTAILTDLAFVFHRDAEGLQKLQCSPVTHGLILTKATQNNASWNCVIAGNLVNTTDPREAMFEFCIGRKAPNDGLLETPKINIEEPGISRYHARICIDRDMNVRIQNHSEKNEITVVRMSDGLGHSIPHANGVIFDFKAERNWFPIRLDLGIHVFRVELFHSKWNSSMAAGGQPILKRHGTGDSNREPRGVMGMREWTFAETLATVRQHMEEYKSATRPASGSSGSKSSPASPSNAEKTRLKQKLVKWVEKAEEHTHTLRASIERIIRGCEPSVGYGLCPVDSQKWVIPQDTNTVARVLAVKPLAQYTAYDVTWFVNGVDRDLRSSFSHRRSIDGPKLLALTAETLQKEIGVADPAQQQKLLNAIQQRLSQQLQPGSLIYSPPPEVVKEKSSKLVQSTTSSGLKVSRHGHSAERKNSKGEEASLQVPGRSSWGTHSAPQTSSPLTSPLGSPLSSPTLVPPSPSGFLTPSSSTNTTPTSTNSAPDSSSMSASPSASPSFGPRVAPAGTGLLVLPAAAAPRKPTAGELLATVDFNELKFLLNSFVPTTSNGLTIHPSPGAASAPESASTPAPVLKAPSAAIELLASVNFEELVQLLESLPPPAAALASIAEDGDDDSNPSTATTTPTAASAAAQGFSTPPPSGGGGSKTTPMSVASISSVAPSPAPTPPSPSSKGTGSIRKIAVGGGSGGVDIAETPSRNQTPPRAGAVRPLNMAMVTPPKFAPISSVNNSPGAKSQYAQDILATVDFNELKGLLSSLPGSSAGGYSAPPSHHASPPHHHTSPATAGALHGGSGPSHGSLSPKRVPASLNSASRTPVRPVVNQPAADLISTVDFNELNMLIHST